MSDLPVTISELQRDLVKRNFSAVEVVDNYLARVKAFNKELNVFNTGTEDLAYKQAKMADEMIAEKGEKALSEYPLLGVVVAHKDLFLTKGVRTTASSKVLDSFVPEYSSTVVIRMERAGAIMIGKTNNDAWGHGSSGENSDFGPTKNPWDSSRVPGGSSSGSAAAVAGGMAMVGTGTDTGSSVRMPASFCNLVGLKPTYGSVSRYGVVAFASSLDTMGHMTQTVEDNRKIFEVVAGKDEKDGTVLNHKLQITNNKQIRKGKFRVGIPKEYFGEGIDIEVREIIEKVIEEYKKMGVEIVEVSLPHTKYAVAVYYIVQPAECSSNLGRYDGVRFGKGREFFGDEAKRRIMLGTYVLSAGYYDAYYLRAMKVRSKLIEDFSKAYAQVDAILAPVSPTPPFKLGEKNNDPVAMYLSDIYTVSANLAGIPGLAVPGGFTKNGLPVGFQLMGPRFSEEKLFALGEVYQRVTKWHERRVNL